MVKARDRFFFVSGSDFVGRKRAIENIKTRIVKKNINLLNTFTFYAAELDVDTLKKNIFTFSFDQEKIILIKDVLRLTAPVKKFLVDHFQEIISSNYLIAETDTPLIPDKRTAQDKFFGLLTTRAMTFRLACARKEGSLDDFKRALRARNLSGSLAVLDSLLANKARERELGPQILGILVYHAASMGASAAKEKNFQYLWEADRAMKEKGLGVRLVLEELLTKLLLPS